MAAGPLGQRRVLGRSTLPFVNRTELLSEYSAWSQSLEPDMVGVAVFHGVGGIGKSRLSMRIAEDSPAAPSARIDFYLPELRGFDSALVAIRRQLGARLGRGSFPLFDVAFAHYWQQTRPGGGGKESQIPFLEESEILWDIASTFASVPIVGGLFATARAGTKAYDLISRHRLLANPALAGLSQWSAHEVGELLPELLGRDLSERRTQSERPIIYVDTYEALLQSPELVDGTSAAGWLERLIGSARGTTWVITSRDPLGWESGQLDEGLRLSVIERPVRALAREYTRQLVSGAGIDGEVASDVVHDASGGHPFYVELAIESAVRSGTTLASSGAAPIDNDKLVSRFIGHLQPSEQDMLTLLTLVERFDSTILNEIRIFAGLSGSLSLYERITSLALCRPSGDGTYTLESLVRPALAARLERIEPQGLTKRLATATSQRAAAAGRAREVLWLTAEALRLSDRAGIVTDDLLVACEKLATLPELASAESLVRETLATLRAWGEPAALATIAYVRLLRRRGSFAEAEDVLAACRVPERLAIEAELLLADIRREAGKPAEALQGYERVLKLDRQQTSTLIHAHLAIVDRLTVTGRYKQALEAAQDLRGLVGDNDPLRLTRYYRQLGQLFRAAGVPGEAESAFKKAEEISSTCGEPLESARIWTDLADLYCGSHPARAITLATKAIDAHDRGGSAVELAKSQTYLATALWRLGDEAAFRTALHKTEEALQRARYRSGEDRFHVLTAATYLQDGDMDAAEEFARRASRSVEGRDSHRAISLMARMLLRACGGETPADQNALARVQSSIDWLPESELDEAGFPTGYFAILGLPAGALRAVELR